MSAEGNGSTKILTKNIGRENSASIETYLSNGGYEGLRKAVHEMTPEEVTTEVKASGLRGRGGAGFPTGMKWGFLPKDSQEPRYLCLNADESEPGTFKDRLLLERDPHLVLEGVIISSYAINARAAYIYIRGEFFEAIEIMQRAIEEARQQRLIGGQILGADFDLDVHVHVGAGAYICGEETAMLESLEGKRGWPRLKPPFPATKGVFACPTVVNNVETLANVPAIVVNGGEWFSHIGTEGNSGTKLYCLSGCVEKPGVYELPMGVTLRELIYKHGGGISHMRDLKAVIPGGVSAAVLTSDEIDVKMDFDSVAKAGSMLGSAGVIIMDETVCMVKAAGNVANFFTHESCGQCTQCREGTNWLSRILDRIERGGGRESDPDLIIEICDNIEQQTICPLGDAVAMPVRSFVQKFRNEFEQHISMGRCPVNE